MSKKTINPPTGVDPPEEEINGNAKQTKTKKSTANWNLTKLYQKEVGHRELEILPPQFRKETLLCKAEGIAEYATGSRATWKTVVVQLYRGMLPAWKQGGVWYSTEQAINVHREIKMMAGFRRRELSIDDIVHCHPLFLSAIRGEYPTAEQFEAVFRKIGLIVH